MPRDQQDRPLRIVVVAPTPFFADRGCHVRILEQCRAVQRAGHRVTICTYHIGSDVNGVEIRRSLRIPWYQKLSAGPSIHKYYTDGFLLWTVLRECLRQRPDVIHAHLHEGIVIGRLASAVFRVPLVADLQGSLTGELLQHRFMKKDGMLHRLFAVLERVIVRMPHAVLASSQGTLASLPGDVASDPRATVLPDGMDRERFYPDAAGRERIRRTLDVGPDVSLIGYLGVLTEYQGVSVLLHAAKRVLQDAGPAARFLIMGYPDVEKYRQLAEDLGILDRVIFTGRLPYEEARAYLSACDVAVSPKLSLTEANGKLLNYLAVGLPIIASDTPINREILRKAGVLTPPGDEDALAAGLMQVLDDPELARDLKRLALERAEHFCWGELGERLIRIYRGAIDPAIAVQPEHRHPVTTP